VLAQGAYAAASQALSESPLVQATRAWAWWAFKKGGNVTWILTTTSLIVVLPLILEVKGDIMMAEQERYLQLQQQGYTPAQIEQMMGLPPQQAQ
jgi:hypothetical protein